MALGVPASTVEIRFDGTNWVDVTGYCNAANFQRGKTSQLFDTIGPSSGSLTLNNETRRFDPLHASGPYYGNIRPGRHVRVTTASTVTFYGMIADWDLQYDVSGRSIAVAQLEDGLAALGRQQFDEWTASAQNSGQRVAAVAARTEVDVDTSTTSQSIDQGISDLQADNIAWGSSVLAYLQLVTASEYGWLYVSRAGVFTFANRHVYSTATPAVAFADSGSGMRYHAVTTAFGTDRLINRVSIDAPGLTKQTASTTPSADDGIRSLSLSTLLDSEPQMLDMATYLATVYSLGETQVSSVTVKLNTSQYTAGNRTDLCELDITDLVSVTFTPNRTGSAISQTCVVEGVAHDISPEQHVITYYLAAADTTPPFIVDDPVWGIVDGPGYLTF